MEMRKDLKYYMGLNYPIEIVGISEEEGGGFTTTIPQLGKYTFVGDGETIEEALNHLEVVKRDLFENYIKKGISIPEPEYDNEEQFSGRFVIRVPKILHATLSKQAKKNGCSLNQYVNNLLSVTAVLSDIDTILDKKASQITESIKHSDELFENTVTTRANQIVESIMFAEHRLTTNYSVNLPVNTSIQEFIEMPSLLEAKPHEYKKAG